LLQLNFSYAPTQHTVCVNLSYSNTHNDVKQSEEFFFPSIYEIPRTGSDVKCQIYSIDTPMKNIRSCQAVTSPHRPWNLLQQIQIQSKFPLEASELLEHGDL